MAGFAGCARVGEVVRRDDARVDRVRARAQEPAQSALLAMVLQSRTTPMSEPTEPRVYAEPKEPSLLERLRAAPMTFALLAVNFAVFGLAEYSGSTTDNSTLIRFGAAEPLHVWAGEYWRVATCMFLHIGLVHILMNSYMAIGWATSLERMVGKWRFLAIYLLSGVAGGCASVVSGLLLGPRISAGASGALFGVLGATLAIRRRAFPSWSTFFANPGVRSVAIQVGIWTAIGLTVLHLDNAAHFGGLAAGSIAAWLFTSRAPRMGWVGLGAALVTLFIVSTGFWWSPKGEDRDDVAVWANSYLTGTLRTTKGPQPIPVDAARGVRLATKGCSNGIALACEVLASHVERQGAPDAAQKAGELRKRTCELDPALCTQMH
jgi:membrane associated rhomboid family serine protease